jgi:hypothetical protein
MEFESPYRDSAVSLTLYLSQSSCPGATGLPRIAVVSLLQRPRLDRITDFFPAVSIYDPRVDTVESFSPVNPI